ncbi:hypothetical protein H5U35_02600 [Candidatus Aerophobetes bacterium]|nr:hypothetical protein [Candidatus Aerophobetes bacterium]
MKTTILIFFISFLITFIIFPKAIIQLKKAKIVGKDLNKPGEPEVAEMGGLIMVAGFTGGVILAIAIETFFSKSIPLNLVETFALLSTVLMIAIIGVIDDLILLPKIVKAITPLFASFPLVAIKAGYEIMNIPFLGQIDFGIIYPLFLIPLGITGAANATNMLAGFNGLEVGMGTVAIASLSVIAFVVKASTSFIVFIAALGALIATLRYNWYPAKVLIGDVGTLSIGAIIAAGVIVGNFELAGVIVIIPYFIDFFFKLAHGFPSKGWKGEYKDGKLHCPSHGPVSLCQLIMKISGGISEKGLVLTLILVEAVFGITAIFYYLRAF